MSTQVLTLDELQVDKALGLDPFGALFAGRVHSDQRRVVVLGIQSRPDLTESSLKQALRAPLSVTHVHVAPLVGYGVLSQENQGLLSGLISQSSLATESHLPTLNSYLIYQLDATPVHELLGELSESARVHMVHELISGLEALHKKRAHHLSLTLNSLWLTAEGTLQITHCGVGAILKPRGLSLNRDAQHVPPHIAPRLRYASPEEVSGKLTNHICDLYSANYIAYELLTGSQLLGEGLSQSELIEAVTSGVASRISNHLSKEWAALFTRGLSVNTRERFTSASLMSRALQEVLGTPVTANVATPDGMSGHFGETTPEISPVTAHSSLGPELSDELDFTMNEGDDEQNDEAQASSMSLAVQSLRSQLSQQSSPAPQGPDAQSSDEAQAGIDELAFGSADQADEMAFGFSQDDAGERTFLEYSDVDEKTVFEQDLPEILESQQVSMQQVSEQHAGGPQLREPEVQSSAATAFGLPSIELQAPDFLNERPSNLEPSRVLPIPTRPQMQANASDGALSQSPHQSTQDLSARSSVSSSPSSSLPHSEQPQGDSLFTSSQAFSAGSQPSTGPSFDMGASSGAELLNAAPPLDDASPLSSAPMIARQPTPSYISSANDWPGGDELQAYTPPDSEQLKPKARKTPRLKERAPIGKRLKSLLIPSTLIILGGFGIYWVSSHWDQFSRSISELVESESVTHLQIASSPPDMTVWINGRPHTKTPAVFSYEKHFSVGGHGFSVGDELKIKFVWRNKRTRKRQIHQSTIQALAGESNLYFISSPKRSTKYAQTLIKSPQEVSRVSLDGQQIGQTPLVIVGPRNMSLSLEFQGLTLNERQTVKLGAPQSGELIIGPPASESAQ